MLNDFDYTTVPYTFHHCINRECIQADKCLRYQLMSHVTDERASIPIINPTRIPTDGKNCPYFFSVSKSQFALGITHLLDNVPHKKAKEIKREIFNYLKRATYYRVVHKERLLSPAEQKFIRQLFLDMGINEEPLFDNYVEEYEW